MSRQLAAARKRNYRQVARAESSQETERRILEAATRLFAERFYDEVTLEDVAALAGVSTKTVMRRFGTKEALAGRFIEGASRVNGAQRDAVATGDVDGAVRMIVDMYELFGETVLRILSLDGRVPVVTAMAAEGRRLHSAWVERVFGPLVRTDPEQRRLDLSLLVVATDVYSWKLLRHDRGFTAAETVVAIRRLVDRIIAP